MCFDHVCAPFSSSNSLVPPSNFMQLSFTSHLVQLVHGLTLKVKWLPSLSSHELHVAPHIGIRFIGLLHPIHAHVLSVLNLCKSYDSNHSYSEPMSTMSILCP